MRRFGLGVLVGILLAAALAGAGAAKVAREATQLTLWKGEGARPGLYYGTTGFFPSPDAQGVLFYECQRVGAGKITPPAPR